MSSLPLNVESWIWCAFGVGIIFTRLISRSLFFRSFSRLQCDDWIMGIFVTSAYIVLLLMSNIQAKEKTNLLPPGFDVTTLTPHEIADRQYGSKIVIVVEQMQIAVIWACKACLLILYHRLTDMVLSKENMAIKLLSAYVAVGFVVMEILYFAAWCRPFDQYWAVPTKSSQCNALINHRIINAVFNISSDLIMLLIALGMFIRSLLPLKRKLVLCAIFSLGIFVIIAAALNKYYSFMDPYEPTWIFWYIRESSTAILVANLPFTWTLLRRIFNLGAFDEAHPPPPTYHSSRTAGGRRTARAHQPHHHGNGSGNGSYGGGRVAGAAAEKQFIGNNSGTSQSTSTNHTSTARNSNSTSDPETSLLKESIQPYDFGAIDIDLEQGLSRPHTPQRPLSPNQVRHQHNHHHHHSTRIHTDGTGGFYIDNRPAVPQRAYLPTTHIYAAPLSRDPSAASTNRRPMSPTPSHASSHGGTGAGATVHAGGGRSARDRKMRARLSA